MSAGIGERIGKLIFPELVTRSHVRRHHLRYFALAAEVRFTHPQHGTPDGQTFSAELGQPRAYGAHGLQSASSCGNGFCCRTSNFVRRPC